MAFLVTWGLAFALYMLFAGQVSLSESVTGLIVASLAALWARLMVHFTQGRFAFSAEAAVIAARAFFELPLRVAKSIPPLSGLDAAGRSPGRADTAPFDTGEIEDSRERTRRAMAVLAASLAPDSFIQRADLSEERVLIHGIVKRPPPNPRSLL